VKKTTEKRQAMAMAMTTAERPLKHPLVWRTACPGPVAEKQLRLRKLKAAGGEGGGGGGREGEGVGGRGEGVGSTVEAAAPVAGAASKDAAAWEAATGVSVTPSPPAASTEVCD
jgi:hypothetical protein